jgi:hypothetical protein
LCARAHRRRRLDAEQAVTPAKGLPTSLHAAKDGPTNPAAVNGNTRPSLSADDDGGFFKERVRAY